ncbi:MAG: S8 family peptidase [Thiohalomonadales bacterium]
MKPILIFPKPEIKKRPIGKRQARAKQHIPSHARQKVRLVTAFNLLETNFNNGILSVDPAGYAPERTLVFETAGSIDDFYNAVSKIAGLYFLQEILGADFEPDDDYYTINKKGQKKDTTQKSFVYLTMANQKALNQIMSYWNNYKNQEDFKFPNGLAPLGHLFDHLKNIRFWDTDDRLYNTGLTEDWKIRVAEGQDVVPVEIELWYKLDNEVRTSKETRIRKLIKKLGGNVLTTCVIGEIHYHSVLVSIPVKSISQFFQDNPSEIELMRCDEVMFFRPSGQCMTPLFQADKEHEYIDENPKDKYDEILNEPIVALLDGLPLGHHDWIKEHIIIDDPDGWSSAYSPKDQKHGTSMASLIIRGDMQSAQPAISRKLYCRPILKPENTFSGDSIERIPEGVLPIDLVHRAVRRMFETEDDNITAPTIKVINLSIADPKRLFEYQMSPWAKLIDYLSVKYKVLFVISAGNHIYDLELGITNEEFNKLSSDDTEALIIKCISDTTHLRRLMSPAESINALTIGAYHHDEFSGHINPYFDRNMPSTINPVTWGKKGQLNLNY